MHPMFVTLYLDNGADDGLADEEDRRRASNRARRARASRSRLVVRAAARDRDRRPGRA